MKRSALIALLLMILVLLGGWFLYGRLFQGPEAEGPSPIHITTDVAAPDGGASVADARGPGDGGRTVAAAGAADGGSAARLVSRARVVDARGLVQVRSQNGEWRDLAAGEELDADDSVRTGRGAEARLQIGQGIEVRLSPRSEFSIRELTEGVSRVRLEQGRVSASVDENGERILRVEARGSDAVAESKGGKFGMVTDGKGQVAVATETGNVKLTAKGTTVNVGAGEQSTVVMGQAPSAPAPVPRSLFLKVVDPEKLRTNRATTVVRGTTQPGALVRVNDHAEAADERGRFRVPVALKEGSNHIEVEVVDAAGRAKAYDVPDVVVDRKKPEIDATMQWGGGGGSEKPPASDRQ